MVDHRVKLNIFKNRQMGRLRVKHYFFRIVINLDILQPFSRDFQQVDHGQVAQPSDLIGIADGDILYPVAQQTLHCHGTGEGIRVSANDHQNVVILLENFPEIMQPFFCRVAGGSAVPALPAGFMLIYFQKLPIYIQTDLTETDLR